MSGLLCVRLSRWNRSRGAILREEESLKGQISPDAIENSLVIEAQNADKDHLEDDAQALNGVPQPFIAFDGLVLASRVPMREVVARVDDLANEPLLRFEALQHTRRERLDQCL